MIDLILAALALQASPYEAFNPTIPYTQCMRKGLSARLSGGARIEAGGRVGAFEQTLAECAALRTSAISSVDLMISRMAQSGGTPPDPRFNGTVMMGIWDKTFQELTLDPEFHWSDAQAGKTPK
jgi:hypothetical protein